MNQDNQILSLPSFHKISLPGLFYSSVSFKETVLATLPEELIFELLSSLVFERHCKVIKYCNQHFVVFTLLQQVSVIDT